MRAVNLIPVEDRRGSSGTAGRSGGAVYVLLGALTLVVLAVAAYVLTANTITSRKAEVVKLQAQASAAEQRAAALRPYRDFATLRRQRVATVSTLAASRFDWDRALHDLAIVLPADSWLTSVTGSVAPGVSLESGAGGAGSGDTSALRQLVTAPALEITGCTVSQSEVSRVLARLRRIHGVTRVTLASSEKIDQTAGAGASAPAPAPAAGSTGTDCRNGSTRFPQFSVVAFFSTLPGQTATAPGAAPGAPAPAGSGTGTTTSAAQPAAATSTPGAGGSNP